MNEIAAGWFGDLVRGIVRAIELAGIAAIVGGGLVATALFVQALRRGSAFAGAYGPYRIQLGRAILLGLELLVAADIVGTVALDPNVAGVAALGLIVIIRTLLSFSLEVEINGHWPWEESRLKAAGRKERA
ncbi:MAG: DUF1622 domain-containing protein [Gemmatimonadales bacterium]